MATQMARGWAVVSVALNVEAAFLFATSPTWQAGCPGASTCLPIWGPLVGWQLILALGWLPLLPLLRPQLAVVGVTSQSFLVALAFGLFFANLFVLALPVLFLGGLAGAASGLILGFDCPNLPLGRQMSFAAFGWIAATAVLVVNNAYSAVNAGTFTQCLTSGGYSNCVTAGPYLWPYAQTLVLVLLVGGSVPLLMQVRPLFWPAGILGAATILGGTLWFVGLNLPLDVFPFGVVTTLGAVALLGTSWTYFETWKTEKARKRRQLSDLSRKA